MPRTVPVRPPHDEHPMPALSDLKPLLAADRAARRRESDKQRGQSASALFGVALGLLFGAWMGLAILVPAVSHPLIQIPVALAATLAMAWRRGAIAGLGVGLGLGSFAGFQIARRLTATPDIAPAVVGWLLGAIVFAAVGLAVGLLRRSLEETTAIAEHDRMTGLVNRTGFLRRMEAEANRSRRSGWPIAIGFLDLDRFKQLNDTRGHAAGDRALKLIADALAENIRNYDTAARLGGDEFAVLWPVQSAAGAETAGRRLHQTLLDRAADGGFDLGVSLGLAVFESIPKDAGELLARADELMYEAKQTGRGKVVYRIYRDAEGARETDERR